VPRALRAVGRRVRRRRGAADALLQRVRLPLQLPLQQDGDHANYAEDGGLERGEVVGGVQGEVDAAKGGEALVAQGDDDEGRHQLGGRGEHVCGGLQGALEVQGCFFKGGGVRGRTGETEVRDAASGEYSAGLRGSLTSLATLYNRFRPDAPQSETKQAFPIAAALPSSVPRSGMSEATMGAACRQGASWHSLSGRSGTLPSGFGLG